MKKGGKSRLSFRSGTPRVNRGLFALRYVYGTRNADVLEHMLGALFCACSGRLFWYGLCSDERWGRGPFGQRRRHRTARSFPLGCKVIKVGAVGDRNSEGGCTFYDS